MEPDPDRNYLSSYPQHQEIYTCNCAGFVLTVRSGIKYGTAGTVFAYTTLNQIP